MLSDRERDRLCVVLVRARNSSNIGAAARAMRDFGFAHLRVVNEFTPPFEAARSAIDASEIMSAARMYASVAEAVADCTLVVGTTAVGERNLEHELLELPAAGSRIGAALGLSTSQNQDVAHPIVAGPRVALLFGSEKTGLSNEELSYCHWLLTIPMHQIDGQRHVSMNLGQAVAVCLYELVRGAEPRGAIPQGREQVTATEPPADSESLERITALFQQVLEATEYTRRHAANSEPAQVRRLVRRIGVDRVDAPVWMGILRQILWKLGLASREE
ncbi:MAG TPA: TrmH family RNA methyltransferase [Acidobacteriaceae bacterium]|nr:TrmH family RNA methyltransferase [Acidobacteriaceae bacterium]